MHFKPRIQSIKKKNTSAGAFSSSLASGQHGWQFSLAFARKKINPGIKLDTFDGLPQFTEITSQDVYCYRSRLLWCSVHYPLGMNLYRIYSVRSNLSPSFNVNVYIHNSQNNWKHPPKCITSSSFIITSISQLFRKRGVRSEKKTFINGRWGRREDRSPFTQSPLHDLPRNMRGSHKITVSILKSHSPRMSRIERHSIFLYFAKTFLWVY